MSRLQVEPRIVELGELSLGSITLWRVIVDEAVLTETAEPFGAGDALIVMNQCLECGYCGLPDVAVRRQGDVVLWTPESHLPDPWFAESEFHAFDRWEYELACGRGQTADLPEYAPADVVEAALRRRFPDWREGLYVIPDLKGDPQGRIALRELHEALLGDRDSVRFLSVGRTTLLLRIGLERPGAPEAVFEIGTTADELAVRMNAFPDCPFWITGPRLSVWARKRLESAELSDAATEPGSE